MSNEEKEREDKEQEDKNKIILKLNSQYKIKYEEYKDFKTSFFRDVYDRMSNAVLEIVEKNKTLNPEREGDQICNIVALLGRRGSGKSSVLASYCGFLKTMDGIKDHVKGKGKGRGCDGLLDKQGEAVFTVLDSIDATLFESGENLLVIILSKMLDKLEQRRTKRVIIKRDINEQVQDLRRLKNEIARIYEYVAGKRSEEDEPSIVKLQALSNSWNLRKAFKDLVEKYLYYMKNYYYDDNLIKDNYIVIPIDDVDMNVEGCIVILERLRKFLMVPKVIVLLTVNHEQLKSICEQFFYKQMGRYKKDADLKDRLQVQNLAKEYLEKMLPTGRKIMMPDLYGDDGVENREFEIQGEQLNGLSEFSMTPEKYIANVIRFYTGVICDIGIDRAYLITPSSLRKLNNYVREFLCLQVPIDDNRKFLPDVYEWNMKWLYGDITHRYVEQSDGCIDVELINGFCKKERGDQFAYLADYLKELVFQKFGKKGKKCPSNLLPIVEICGQGRVSFGDAVYLLYLAETQELLNRETVYCLKMLISAYMTNLTINYSMSDESRRGDWKKKLDQYTREDLTGYWERAIFGGKLAEIGCRPEKTKQIIIASAEEDGDLENGDPSETETHSRRKRGIETEKWSDTEENIEIFKDMADRYFYSRMFLKPVQKINEKSEKYNDNMKGMLRLRLAEDCIWGLSCGQFVYHIFTYKEFSKTIREEIKKQLEIVYDFTEKDFARMEEHKIFDWEEQFDLWVQNTGYGLNTPALIPFYSVDFMTSLYAGLAEGISTKVTKAEELVGGLQDLFKAITRVLAEYDGYYDQEGKLTQKLCIDRLLEKYEKCPFTGQEEELGNTLFKVMDTLIAFSRPDNKSADAEEELEKEISKDSGASRVGGREKLFLPALYKVLLGIANSIDREGLSSRDIALSDTSADLDSDETEGKSNI